MADVYERDARAKREFKEHVTPISTIREERELYDQTHYAHYTPYPELDGLLHVSEMDVFLDEKTMTKVELTQEQYYRLLAKKAERACDHAREACGDRNHHIRSQREYIHALQYKVYELEEALEKAQVDKEEILQTLRVLDCHYTNNGREKREKG